MSEQVAVVGGWRESLERSERRMHVTLGRPGRHVCLWPSAGWWGAPWGRGLSASTLRAFPNLKSGTCGRGQGLVTGVCREPASQWLLPFLATESVI